MRDWTHNSDRRNRKGLLYCLAFFVSIFHFFPPDSFAEMIKSRSAVAMDVSTGEILYSKNPDQRLSPASTAKLMTAIVVMENETLSNMVTISRNASHVRPTKAGFKEGDRVTVEGLLYAALLRSANDAAVALSEAVSGSEEKFVDLMNQKAISIGAMNTKFVNSTGLPGPGQYITAVDLSMIMKYAMRYNKLREIIGTPIAQVRTEKGKSLVLKNTDKLLGSDEKIIGGKTGYTDSAKHCFVCIAEHERKTVIVTLLGSRTRGGLWKETGKIIALVSRR
jgi:serine-type D-Ala-D-Ala carboxypeptidase (penicillin-binding protein 5/6)